MMKSASLDEARAAKSHALDVFEKLAVLSGVGITRVGDGYGLKVNLARPPDGGVSLPTEVDGVPVRIEVVGPVKKRSG